VGGHLLPSVGRRHQPFDRHPWRTDAAQALSTVLFSGRKPGSIPQGEEPMFSKRSLKFKLIALGVILSVRRLWWLPPALSTRTGT
jgi:hypothetical protein